MISLTIYLFGKPEWEISDESVSPSDIRAAGEKIKSRLDQVADTVQKLKDAGWEGQIALYNVLLTNNDVTTQEQAEDHLASLGIDKNAVKIDLFE